MTNFNEDPTENYIVMNGNNIDKNNDNDNNNDDKSKNRNHHANGSDKKTNGYTTEPMRTIASLVHAKEPDVSSDREAALRLIRQFTRRFLRGFTSGVCLQAGVSAVAALMHNPFRDSLAKAWGNVYSRYCLQTATFLGLYPSVYHLMVHLLIKYRNVEDGWNHGISGALAGLSIIFMDSSRRQTITFFALSRALGAGISTLVAREHLPVVPFVETLAFSACTAVIVYCTALRPDYLTTGYYYSILKWSRDYTDKRLTKLFRTPGPTFLTCEDVGLHPGSCLRHRLLDCLRSLPAFAKVYLPIHLTPIVVFKRDAVRKRPKYVLQSFLKNMLVSTSFLGLMVMIAKLTICLLRNHANRPPPLPAYIPSMAGTLCALALLLERYRRRKELALFVLSHTLSIFHTVLENSGVTKYIHVPCAFTLMFAISMMPVMHAYERQPESLSMLINGLLRFFVGERTHKSQVSIGRKETV